MRKEYGRSRWLFPLALQPVALDHQEYRIRREAMRLPEEALSMLRDAVSDNTLPLGARRETALPWPTRLRTALLRHLGYDLDRHAVHRAQLLFRRTYAVPDSLRFDGAFLRGAAARAVAAGDPKALAWAWTAQFVYDHGEVAKRRVHAALLVPAAAAFLDLVTEQVGVLRSPTRTRTTPCGGDAGTRTEECRCAN